MECSLGEKWLELGCMLIIEPTGFADGLVMRCKKREKSSMLFTEMGQAYR